MADRRNLVGGRRDDGEQPRHLREHLRRRAQGLLDLGPGEREVEREDCGPRLRRREQVVDVEPVAGLGRHAPGRRVRVRQQAEPLELGELRAHGRRRDAQSGPLDEGLRADRLSGRHVLLDDAPQDVALPL